MKKIWLATGAIVGLCTLTVGYFSVLKPAIEITTDCRSAMPLLDLQADNVGRFYSGIAVTKNMTPTLAQQLATNVEQQLLKLPQAKLKNSNLRLAYGSLRVEMKTFPETAREWATLNKPLGDYLRFRDQRDAPGTMLVEGGRGATAFYLECSEYRNRFQPDPEK
jgi:hypothetical protein